jgi:hypothetical protein
LEKKKKRKKKRDQSFPCPFFWGSKNDNFLTLDDTLQFVSYLLLPLGLNLLLKKKGKAMCQFGWGGGGTPRHSHNLEPNCPKPLTLHKNLPMGKI